MAFRNEVVELLAQGAAFAESARAVSAIAARHAMTLVDSYQTLTSAAERDPAAAPAVRDSDPFPELVVRLDAPRAAARFVHPRELEEAGARLGARRTLRKPLELCARLRVTRDQRGGELAVFVFSGAVAGDFSSDEARAIKRDPRLVALLVRRSLWREALIERCLTVEQVLTASVATGMVELTADGSIAWTSGAAERAYARLVHTLVGGDGSDSGALASRLRAVASHADDPALGKLSSREIEVLAELCQGKKNHEIARALCVSPATVRTHLSRIFAKLEVRTRTQAALVGRLAGLGAAP